MAKIMDQVKIENVSDTSLWVAMFRAKETRRPDALFRDPLAAVLAGERGQKLEAQMPYAHLMYWALVVRTVAIDRLIERALQAGVDTVLNLGAGLDCRPYRMNLLPGLKWIEVDFPNIIELKKSKLQNEKPACQLRRIALDLSDVDKRRQMFAEIGGSSSKILVITEGVIPYFSPAQVAELADDLYAVPSFHFWIQDYRNGGYTSIFIRRLTKKLTAAPLNFDAKDVLAFFAKHRWVVDQAIVAEEEGQRIGRPRPPMFPWRLLRPFLTAKKKEQLKKSAGLVMFKR